MFSLLFFGSDCQATIYVSDMSAQAGSRLNIHDQDGLHYHFQPLDGNRSLIKEKGAVYSQTFKLEKSLKTRQSCKLRRQIDVSVQY